jgi:hypothetical protein
MECVLQVRGALSAQLSATSLVVLTWSVFKAISSQSEALHSILDAYQRIGEQIPAFPETRILHSSPHLKEIFTMVYKDVLSFHQDILKSVTIHRMSLEDNSNFDRVLKPD